MEKKLKWSFFTSHCWKLSSSLFMVKACFPGGDVGDLFVVKICLLESDNDDDDCGDEVACC